MKTTSWPARLRTYWRPSFVFLQPGSEDGTEVGQTIPPHDLALMAWRRWCEAHQGHRCMLGLSNQWLINAVVPLSQARHPALAIDQAALQWDHYFNVSAQQLKAAWRVRTVRAGDAWLLSAMPEQLVADVLAVAKTHGVSVAWMGPWWAHGGQRWFDQMRSARGPAQASHMLIVQEPQWHVFFEVHEHHLASVWARPGKPAQQTGAPGVSRVDLSAAQQVDTGVPLWDGASCSDVLSGRSPQWSVV